MHLETISGIKWDLQFGRMYIIETRIFMNWNTVQIHIEMNHKYKRTKIEFVGEKDE